MNNFEQDRKEWDKKRGYESRKAQSNIAFIVAGVFCIGGFGPGIVIPLTNEIAIGAMIGIICGIIALVVVPLIIGILLRKLYKKEKQRVEEIEKKYGKQMLFDATWSERSLNASVRALSDAVKRTTFTHLSSPNDAVNSNTFTTTKSREEYYDYKGILRKSGDSYYDYTGTLRRPDESYVDGKGILRKPGENYFDSKGILRRPDENYFDGNGTLRSK